MSTKPESRRQRRIREKIESRFPGSRFIKIHVSDYQGEGEPDLLGCVRGMCCAFEVKEPDEPPRPLQSAVLKLWQRSGACVGVVETGDQAIALICAGLLKW
jgi:hypothetical protein